MDRYKAYYLRQLESNWRGRRTKRGVLATAFNQQSRRKKFRDDQKPSYTREQLIVRFINDKHYTKLYNNYFFSGYKKDLRPSIDRIDPNKGYSFDNIQMMTWKENNEKGRTENRRNLVKRVGMYLINNEFIDEFWSIAEAERVMGISHGNIVMCCQNKRPSASGYIFRYLNGYRQ